MNYIINSNINFYEEINNFKDYSYEEEICLLTGENLTDNYITLNCNHKFNYLPLYNELCKQKTRYNSLETTKLLINEIKCPYCREITDKILPFIIDDNVELKNGINYPSKYCMKINNCNWIYKNGKNKNNKCNCSSFIFNNNNYCLKHHKICNKTNTNVDNLLNENVDNLLNENESFLHLQKKYTISKLKEILKENKLKISGKKNELLTRLLVNNINI